MLCSAHSEIPSGLYQHYKGPYYRVLGTSRHSESDELLVLYQALYGQKGYWSRPLNMFIEEVETTQGKVPRFAYCNEQSIVLEVARLRIAAAQETEYRQAFAQALPLIQRQAGFIDCELKPAVDHPVGNERNNEIEFLLLVIWQDIKDHIEGFRRSDDYQMWSELLHPFYSPMPTVRYFRL